jgi:hypothetical protein
MRLKILRIFVLVLIVLVAGFLIAPTFTIGDCAGSKAVPWWPSGCSCLGIIVIDKSKKTTPPLPGSYGSNICKGIILKVH